MCNGRHGLFLVEATVLSATAVEERSGLPNELGDTVRAFSMVILVDSRRRQQWLRQSVEKRRSGGIGKTRGRGE